ncbi:GntR family transcriptional regulator of arabinose operon [Bacillus pakistanensis]|uniref:GntR family transcriptional regulator of arabinose operon n=1 Tax=Rossellomorea pakistanensis TaxID=992288 RepID=A0ABS2NC34_9BACI|nr:GntR family transcriptional regulator [Bacillus pakistanensis]MBM7585422.1 GntR family transcriptional regulator of arabinose operon [Bacillus pakistanensis]
METKYSIVKKSIKSKILDGTYEPHEKIASESEMMRQFNVSRHTVRLAIGELVSEGWLYRSQGAGTFCADRNEQQRKEVGSRKNIAIVTTYISDYIFPSIIRGAEASLSEQGYQVTLFNTNNDHDKEREYLEKIITQGFDGAIIEPTQSAYTNPNINYYLNLERLNIPYIMINAYYDALEPVRVVVDDERGAFLQTEHLIERGHREILGFFKTDDMQGTLRMKGYLKAHRKYNVPINPKHMVSYNTFEKHDKPIEELKSFLTQPGQRPTAIVCYNDELAMKLLDVIRENNLRVPEDISIIGFDNSILAEMSEVKLTTIEHPKSDLGKTAGKLILSLIKPRQMTKDASQEVKSVIYSPELVLRSSTKDINGSRKNLKDAT